VKAPPVEPYAVVGHDTSSVELPGRPVWASRGRDT